MNLRLWDTLDASSDSPSDFTDRPVANVRYAQVLVNVTAKTLQSQIFTYRLPEEFADIAQVGQPVLVAFGAQQDLTGFITDISDPYDGPYKLKDITDILDETPLFDAAYYDFIRWVAD